MPTWEQLEHFMNVFGVPMTILVFVGVFIWKYGGRYVTSVEKLHDSIGSNMTNQQALCDTHGKIINSHDHAMRKAALEACAMCRSIAEKELPNSSALVGKHCDEIERIIGEA